MKEISSGTSLTIALFEKGKLPKELGAQWAEEKHRPELKDPVPGMLRYAEREVRILYFIFFSVFSIVAIWIICGIIFAQKESALYSDAPFIGICATLGINIPFWIIIYVLQKKLDRDIKIWDRFSEDVAELTRHFYPTSPFNSLADLRALVRKILSYESLNVLHTMSLSNRTKDQWYETLAEWLVFAKKVGVAQRFNLISHDEVAEIISSHA